MINQEFWAITAYFNPAGWSTRLANYRLFRQALNIPLLTVEWSPDGKFQLQGSDADRLVQIQGGDLMWQKERLLLNALSILPGEAKYVAWLDCDLIFVDPRWVDEAREALRHAMVIQPYRDVIYLDDHATHQIGSGKGISILDTRSRNDLPIRHSFASLYEIFTDDIVTVDLDTRFKREQPFEHYSVLQRPAYGHAWAARVAEFRQIGLFDRCVLGGGDLFFCYGLIGKSRSLISNHLDIGWDYYTGGDHYESWSENASTCCGGNLASTSSTLLHLFHGTLNNRQYKSRIDELKPFQLDLGQDLMAAEGQPWTWAREREKLNEYFMRYMKKRNEDTQ